jgi:hypothetical protein
MQTLTVTTEDRIDIWPLSSQLMAIARPIAKKLGVTLKQFLTKLSLGELPRKLPPIRTEATPVGFQVTLPVDEALKRRILRAVEFDKTSVEDLAWEALTSFVETIEEDYVVADEESTVGGLMELEAFRQHLLVERA